MFYPISMSHNKHFGVMMGLQFTLVICEASSSWVVNVDLHFGQENSSSSSTSGSAFSTGSGSGGGRLKISSKLKY